MQAAVVAECESLKIEAAVAAAVSVTCVVCLEDEADFLCLPCGHQCGCNDCLVQIRAGTNQCPMCRGAIGGLQRVFRG